MKGKTMVRFYLLALSFGSLFIMNACTGHRREKAPEEVVIVTKPEEVQAKANEQIQGLIEFLEGADGRLNDSTIITNLQPLAKVYDSEAFQPLWSRNETWLPLGDSLFMMISRAKLYGLFPSDYHLAPILKARNRIVTDSLSRKNIALWARTDILLTDAFFRMANHLKYGRLNRDSTTLRSDTAFSTDDLVKLLQQARSANSIREQLESVEPRHPGYQAIKAALPAFLDSVKFEPFTYIQFPGQDSMEIVAKVAKRLQEAGRLKPDWNFDDSTTYKTAVREYQRQNGIRTTGIAAEQTIASLNNTNWEKFKRIAINLDRYKQLPVVMPATYVWVNLPAYQLRVMDSDTAALTSKIIVGAPKTRSPVLTSEIVNFITYPQWTVPYSIIFKEMLPKIQKDISYLAKQNLMVVDKNDSVIDPASINWYKLSKTNFPYLLRQRQGDDNSLGLMKFNFRNKYDVYLHDTNARSLFGRNIRALSHGCIRVQEWEKLSHFLVRNDSVRYAPDTIRAWIGRQEKHIISNFLHLPIFIRYFTCEAQENKIRFYDDVYGDDRLLAQRYFADKPIN